MTTPDISPCTRTRRECPTLFDFCARPFIEGAEREPITPDVFGSECPRFYHTNSPSEEREALHEQAYNEFREYIS